MGHIEPYWKKRTHKTQSSSWWLFHHLTESTERKWYDPSYTSQTCPLVALSFNSQQYNTTEMRHKIRTYNQNHCSKSQRDQGIIDPSPTRQSTTEIIHQSLSISKESYHYYWVKGEWKLRYTCVNLSTISKYIQVWV